MDLNKKNMKRIALLIAFGLLLYWGLNHPGQAGQMLSTVFSIFLPFLLGGCLAFLLNVILRPVERGWRRAWGKRYGPRQKRAQRPVCLLVSTLLLVGVVFAIFFREESPDHLFSPDRSESLSGPADRGRRRGQAPCCWWGLSSPSSSLWSLP